MGPLLQCARPCSRSVDSTAPTNSSANPFTERNLRAFELPTYLAFEWRRREACFASELRRHDNAESLSGIRCTAYGIDTLPPKVVESRHWSRVLTLLASPEAACPATNAVLQADVLDHPRFGNASTSADSSSPLAAKLVRDGVAPFDTPIAARLSALLRGSALRAVTGALDAGPSRHGITSIKSQQLETLDALGPLLRHGFAAFGQVAKEYIGSTDAASGGVVALRLPARNLSKRECMCSAEIEPGD